jgi:hypothetical protein
LGKKLVKDAIFATFFRESGAKNLNEGKYKGVRNNLTQMHLEGLLFF